MALTPSIIRGAVSTDLRTSNIHPENWNPDVYMQQITGRAPMTAILMAMGKGSTKSKTHHWWQKAYNSMNGAVVDVYSDAALSSAYASGGVSGSILYISLTTANAKKIVSGDMMTIVDSNNVMRTGHVIQVLVGSDTTSYACIKLKQTDTSNILAGATLTFFVSGNVQAEMSELPDTTFEEPTEFYNYAPIFMEAAEFSGTELVEVTRINQDVRAQGLKEAYARFRAKMEWQYIFGIRSSSTGANGKPLLFMDGIRTAISDNESTNILNFKTDSSTPAGNSIAGATWLSKGMTFIEDTMEFLSRTSDNPTKTAFCGSLAALAINQVVLDAGHYEIGPATNEYGINVHRIKGLVQTLDIITHQGFTANSALRNSMLIIEPEYLRDLPMEGRDIRVVKPGEVDTGGHTWVDGTKEGWYRQSTLEYNNLACMAWIDKIGITNTAS